MKTLCSYLGDRWVEGSGAAQTLVNPATEEPLAQVSSEGLELAAALDHARRKGGPALRALSFAERGALLKEMAKAIQAHRDELLDLAVANGGNTRSDAKFDVDGAIFTLQTYAEIGASLGTAKFLVEGEGVQLGRSPRFHGLHINVPRHGVAVQINAFNFPAWGLAEKAASALLAGMPVLSKPATSSAMVAHRGGVRFGHEHAPDRRALLARLLRHVAQHVLEESLVHVPARRGVGPEHRGVQAVRLDVHAHRFADDVGQRTNAHASVAGAREGKHVLRAEQRRQVARGAHEKR